MRRGVAAFAAAVLVLQGCVPSAATAEGREIETLYGVALWIAIGIVALVWGIGVFAILRYRRRRHDAGEPEQIHGSVRLEVVWTTIPLLIVLGLFVGTLVVLGRTEARAADAVVVEVSGFRWGWSFRYPSTGFAVTGVGPPGPEVVVPVGVPLEFRLHAEDVMHSFYVPLFLFKRDLIPGQDNVFDVTIAEPGTYGGQCAEFCGIGHSAMPFTVRAVTQQEFDAWLASPPMPAPGSTAPPPVAPSSARPSAAP